MMTQGCIEDWITQAVETAPPKSLHHLAAKAGWIREDRHRNRGDQPRYASRAVLAALKNAGYARPEQGVRRVPGAPGGGYLIGGEALAAWPNIAKKYPRWDNARFSVVSRNSPHSSGRTLLVRIGAR